jgi:hypothetical protein
MPIFFVFSITRSKKQLFLQMGLQEIGYSNFELCLSGYPKWVFHIGILLEVIGIVLEIHFGFGFRNGSPVGDSLSHLCGS